MTKNLKTNNLEVTIQPSIKNFIYLFATIIYFVLSSLLSRQVSLSDSLSLCLFLIIDAISGAIFWSLVSQKNKFSIFEICGTGIVFGTLGCTIIQQILRTTPLDKISPFILPVLTLLIYFKNQKNNYLIKKIDPASIKQIFLVCAITSLAYCSEDYVSWSIVLTLTVGIIFLNAAEKLKLSTGIEFSIAIFFITIAFNLRKYLDKRLFGFSTTSSRVSNYDQVFFEANSRGLRNYGPFDNIFLSNTKFAYYWFSDAWAGALTAQSGVREWIVTTEFGLLIACLGSIFLAKAICTNRQYSEQQSSTTLILIATASLQGNANYAFSSQSFSLTVSVLLMIFILFLVNENQILPKSSKLIVLMISTWILIITKTVIAIPFLVGFVALFSFALVKKNYFKAITYVSTVFGGLFLYLIFVKPESSLQGSYSNFSLRPTMTIFEFWTVNPILDFIVFMLLEMSGLFWLVKNKKFFRDDFLLSNSFFLISSFSTSILIKFDGSTAANQYLIIPFLLVLPFLIIESFQIESSKKKSPIAIYICVGLGICAGFIATSGLNYLREKNNLTPPAITLFRLIPIYVSICLCALLFLRQFVKTEKQTVFRYCLVVLVASAPGSYIAHSIKPLQQVILSKDYFEIKDNSLQIKMTHIKPAMKFISSALSPSDVIASNSPDDFGLIAAMTGVRNFASTYTRQLWGNTALRYENQTSFGAEPNLASYRYLRYGCVTWFYYDKSVSETPRTTWDPYAVIRFEDDFGTVLELNDHLRSPNKC